MYNPNDTIIAISSGITPSIKKIIRISGAQTFDILESLVGNKKLPRKKNIVSTDICLAPTPVVGVRTPRTGLGAKHDDFTVEVKLYLFPSPNSYTGDDLIEIHLSACDEVIENLFSRLLALGCRNAEAGEFTYRAYINGKMDLSQAEAVAQLIQSSNQYQLSAARRLFGGSVEKTIKHIQEQILELLSLTEAGLDFSTEDIEIISTQKAIERAGKIRNSLNELLAGSITFEQIIDAPSVIIAGCANAGKSSLVNALIGENRSIISGQSGTTRDVLEHWLKLKNCDCVLSDTAGLAIEPADTLQILANTAALIAIENSTLIIFCVDVTKEDYLEDIKILKTAAWAKAHPTIVIPAKAGIQHNKTFKDFIAKKSIIFAATKCDLLKDNEIQHLKKIFGYDFLQTSSKNMTGMAQLKEAIGNNIIRQTSHTTEAANKTALTERHRQTAFEALKNIDLACGELEKKNEEIAAMFLRTALGNLSSFETEHIDEAVLGTIFSRFCIGK